VHARVFDDGRGQPDLFGDALPPAYRPDPDKVRARLHRILADAGISKEIDALMAKLLDR
jgi:hypothetical protein